MHVVVPSLIIGIVLLLGGLTLIIAREPWAAYIARRRARLYPTGVRSALRFQEKPVYFLVLGIVFGAIGALVILGSLHR